MAGVAPTEKLCLRNHAKKHVKYGAMAKENSMLRDKYHKHTVQPGDTLQGLALKYGVGMEQIKRANKMWTTDSLFLRSTLSIPIYTEQLSVSSMSTSSPPVSPTRENDNMSPVSLESTNHVCNRLNSPTKNMVDCVPSPEDESSADFLIRIDSHIAQQKDNVLKLQKKIVYSEDDLHNSRTGLTNSGYQCRRNSFIVSSSLGDLPGDLASVSQPVVMTKGRKVKHSLQKLEKEQDEIFEL